MDDCYRFVDPYLFFHGGLVPADPVFVEIGSYTGAHAMGLLKAHPDGRVVVYEASPTNFARLEQAIEGTAVIAHNQAVSGSDGQIEFYDFVDSPSSSSIYSRRSIFRRRTRGGSIKRVVPSVSIESLIKDND
ncbi:MAG: FkbM family methyltransferase, partial [Planctomycetota bacterium]